MSAFQSNCHVQTEQLLSEALMDCPVTVFGITAGFLLYIWIFTTYVSHVTSLVAKARKRKRNQQTRIFNMSRSPTQEEKPAVPAGSQMEGWQTKVRIFPYGKQSLGQVSGNQNWRLRATKQDPTTTLCIWEGSSWVTWGQALFLFLFHNRIQISWYVQWAACCCLKPWIQAHLPTDSNILAMNNPLCWAAPNRQALLKKVKVLMMMMMMKRVSLRLKAFQATQSLNFLFHTGHKCNPLTSSCFSYECT